MAWSNIQKQNRSSSMLDCNLHIFKLMGEKSSSVNVPRFLHLTFGDMVNACEAELKVMKICNEIFLHV